MGKISKILLTGFLTFGLLACSSSNNTKEDTKEETNEEASFYTPGTYSSEADGFGGKVYVTIKTDEFIITDVTVEGPDETSTVGGAALEELGEQILQAQSSEIDGVSGATFTSNGVKEAAMYAIAQAEEQ